MKKRTVATMITLGIAAGLLAGCGDNSSSSGSKSQSAAQPTEARSAGEAFTFGFITLADSDVWCKSVCTEFENYVSSTYPECKVVTADGNCDANLQIQAVENFIAQQIDALVIQPVDADATGPAIEAANQAGIPVITTAIKTNAGDYTYVGPENLEAGAMHAQYIMDHCEPGVKILYLQGTAGLSHSTDRYQGFIDTLEEAGFDYELLAAQDGDYLTTEGLRITEDWIQKFPEFDVIVSSNDEMALGAIEALKAANKTGIMVLGLNANDAALEAIKEGTMTASLKQDAVAIADTAADLAVNAAKGEDIEDTYIPWIMITKDNVDTE